MKELTVRAEELLRRARIFNRSVPLRKAVGGSYDVEVITPEELADRLKVDRGWVSEKRRPRCVHPLPALTHRPLRFNWHAILIWLQEEAQMDAERLKHKRASPRRRRQVA